MVNLVSSVPYERVRRFNPEEVTEPAGTQKKVFGEFLQAAFETVNEVNAFQFAAEEAQLNFATGRDDNVLTVLLAQEKAFATLNFTVQVTNKIIESYREIMRMQV